MRSKRISPPPIPLRLLRATWDVRGKAETGGHGLDLMHACMRTVHMHAHMRLLSRLHMDRRVLIAVVLYRDRIGRGPI